jgi:MFS family permease
MEISDAPTSISEAYPERGLKAYSVVFGAWLVLFPASGLLNSTGILQAWLFEHQLQGYLESEVAWIFSTFAFLFFFGGLGVGEFTWDSGLTRWTNERRIGPVFDKYGEKMLVPIGAVGLCTALFATSFCTCTYRTVAFIECLQLTIQAYYHFILSFGILGGLSSSILWTTSIATLGHWFSHNRGLATGLATTAGGFGGVLYPIMFTQLVTRIGFAWTIRCFALLSAACFLGGTFLLKTRLPRNARARLSLDWRGFRDMRFFLTMSAIFILDWAVLVPPAYITTYASHQDLSSISPHILAILNAASIFGRALPGPIADRTGRFNVMILCSTICTASIFGLWYPLGSSVPGLVVFAVTYGFFSGSAYSLTPVCVSQLCKAEEYASRYGTAYGIVSLATLAGVPLSGSILSVDGGKRYDYLILFCGATYAAATVLFVVARGVSRGWGFWTKF